MNQEIQPVTLPPISVLLGKILLAMICCWSLFCMYRFSEGVIPGSMAVFCVFMTTPVVMLAFSLSSTITISKQVIEQTYLGGWSKSIPWDDVKKVKLAQGRHDHREIIIVAGNRKISFTNARRRFADAFRVLASTCEQREIPLKTGLLDRLEDWHNYYQGKK